jgi:type VI secretion system FHA domain protein
VSGYHAVVCFADDAFYVEDTSTNGVFINGADHRLAPGERHRIQSGDRLRIEPFHIEASIATAPAAVEPVGYRDPFASAPQPASVESDRVDPLALLGFDHDSEPEALPSPEPGVVSVINEYYRAPALAVPAPRAERLPSSRTPAGAFALRTPASRDNQRADPRTDASPGDEAIGSRPDPHVSDVLAAAGIHDVSITPELACEIGHALRALVTGLMEVLQARQHTKDEFRIDVTRVKPAENNPLKCCANVDDALRNLIVRRSPAYLGLRDAISDALDDVQQHQIATLAGLRVAFDAMLATFDPDRIQARVDRETRAAALVPMPARLRYWARYRDAFAEMTRDTDTSFRTLFGDAFASAYDEQLKQLKAAPRVPRH